MGKLHENLAVEPDVTGAANALLEEGLNTFHKKEGLFNGMRKTYQPLAEDGQGYPPELVQVVETVPDKLKWVFGALAKAIDVTLTKEVTNTKTSAKLQIGSGLSFGEYPATVFLALEKQLKEVKRLVLAAPTLDPTVSWNADPGRTGIRVTGEIKTQRTEKRPFVVVKYEATKEHPAQTELYNRDEVVGNWTTVRESGMITPKEKADMLLRVDAAIHAVKKARQRANDIEVTAVHVGKKLLDFILNGDTPVDEVE